MCALLEVSRSGFYKWRKSRDDGPSPSQQRRAELDAQVAQFHQASDGVYGAPRILADLRDAGARVSRKTVAASLRRQGLAGISPRRFAPATTVVDLRYHLLADRTGLAVSVRGARRLLAAGDRLGHRGAPAHRSGRVRTIHGGRDARRAGRDGDLAC